MDYGETFAPIPKHVTICTLMTVALVCQWPISQMDVKNTLLNWNIQEEVYMAPSPSVAH